MTPLETVQELLLNPPWLELAANAVNLVSIALATRNSVHTWWTGILGCLLFGWLFFIGQLYADVTLQAFFVLTSALGWWHWLHDRGQAVERPVTRTSPAEMSLTLPAGVLTALGYGWLLHRFTDAYAPFIDSTVLALSIVAQLLLLRRKLETWLFWFAANTLAVPLYASRGLWLTAFFYALFWLNAPLGLLRWRREFRRAPVENPAPATP